MKTEQDIKNAIDDLNAAIKMAMAERMPFAYLEMLANHAVALKWVIGENDGLNILLDKLRNLRVRQQV